MLWKKGRGKLGIFAPLMGVWVAQADSPQGPVTCRRSFSKTLNNSHISLSALWQIGQLNYEELALFGSDRDGKLRFWSFTSDGKQSQGELAEANDVHPEALCFEADMPAGRARQIYWPDEAGGFYWAVESQTKKGWSRFTQHHYQLQEPTAPEAQ
jgi:hypothetical protein